MSLPKEVDDAACLAAVREAIGNARDNGYGAFIDAASDEDLAHDLYQSSVGDEFETDTILAAVKALRWH